MNSKITKWSNELQCPTVDADGTCYTQSEIDTAVFTTPLYKAVVQALYIIEEGNKKE